MSKRNWELRDASGRLIRPVSFLQFEQQVSRVNRGNPSPERLASNVAQWTNLLHGGPYEVRRYREELATMRCIAVGLHHSGGYRAWVYGVPHSSPIRGKGATINDAEIDLLGKLGAV